jgi:hypothetical protein
VNGRTDYGAACVTCDVCGRTAASFNSVRIFAERMHWIIRGEFAMCVECRGFLGEHLIADHAATGRPWFLGCPGTCCH